MRIGTLAARLGTTPHAIRFYERRGLLTGARRTENGYREYGERDVQHLRLLIGLRQLDVPLDHLAEIALCAEGKCDEASDELKAMIPHKRAGLQRRITELSFLDRLLEHLASELDEGKEPRPMITFRKEDPICRRAVTHAAATSTAAAAATDEPQRVGRGPALFSCSRLNLRPGRPIRGA